MGADVNAIRVLRKRESDQPSQVLAILTVPSLGGLHRIEWRLAGWKNAARPVTPTAALDHPAADHGERLIHPPADRVRLQVEAHPDDYAVGRGGSTTRCSGYDPALVNLCTIIAKNYVAQARILAASFRRHHRDGRCFVLIVDEVDGYVDPAAEPFELVRSR